MYRKQQIVFRQALKSLFLLLSYITYGQANYTNYYFPVLPQSPSTDVFKEHGNVQNSEYQGSNNPSINLYNLKSGDIDFPVNLSYISGNGIKVTDEASHVGLGWNISFPTIVQNIHGYDDFAVKSRYRLDFAKSSLPYSSNFPILDGTPANFNQSPSFDTYGYFLATNNNVPIGGTFTNIHSNFASVDMQPDIFVVNLFGEKVEFIVSNFGNYNPAVPQSISFESLSKKGIKIVKTAEGFTLKDIKGFTYKFNNIEQITNNSIPGTVQGKNYLITEIIDTNNRKISFQYTTTGIISNPNSYSWFLNYTTNYNSNFCQQGSSGNLEFFAINEPAPMPNPNRFGALNSFVSNSATNSSQQEYLFPTNITSENGILIFRILTDSILVRKNLIRSCYQVYPAILLVNINLIMIIFYLRQLMFQT